MAAVKAMILSGLKAVAEPLICFGLKAVLKVEADEVVAWLKARATDHSQLLSKAIGTAQAQAWNAVALALGGESFWQKVCDVGRSGDVKAVRDQMRKFIAAADFGPERVPADVRLDACTELKRLTADGILSGAVELDSQDLVRFADLARNVTDAHRAISAVAASLVRDFPNLARVLGLAPTNGGLPLLVAVFVFFLRREIVTHEELFREVSLDGLRDLKQHLTTVQMAGFASLEECLATGFGELGGRIENLNRTVLDLATEFRAERDAVRRERQEWRERNEVRTRTATGQIELSWKSDGERNRLRGIRDRLRKLADTYPEFVPAADLNGMGDDLDAAELFQEALEAHLHAQRVAKAEHDKKMEAEAEFRAYQSACGINDYPTALTHILRAAALDPIRFSPFNRGKYRPERILGHGGFGTVFLCTDRDEARLVAVKSLRSGRDTQEVFQEARTLRELHRPNSRFVQVLHCDYAHTDPHDPDRRERPYIVMEFFEGEPLDRLKNGHRKWPYTEAEAVSVFRQIAEAVHEAHRAGVYHRDLKLSNVLAKRHADGTWELRVIDFGLAIKTLTPGSGLTQFAGSDSPTGTWDYAPPEQRGRAPHIKIGPWSDVFAFGKVLAMALCGNTEVNERSWKHLNASKEWWRLYHDCVDVELQDEGGQEGRFRSFVPVLQKLREIELVVDPAAKAAEQKGEDERRAKEESERKRAEEMKQAEEAKRAAEQNARLARERQEQEAALLRKEKDRLAAELAAAERVRERHEQEAAVWKQREKDHLAAELAERQRKEQEAELWKEREKERLAAELAERQRKEQEAESLWKEREENERLAAESAERQRKKQEAELWQERENDRLAAEMAKTMQQRVYQEAERQRKADEYQRWAEEAARLAEQRAKQEQAGEIQAKQSTENLERWKASGAAERWVSDRLAGWDDDEWRGLLTFLRRSFHWPMDEAAVRRHIETVRDRIREDQRSRKAAPPPEPRSGSFPRPIPQPQPEPKWETKCAGCKIPLVFPTELAGKKASCPTCKVEMTMPSRNGGPSLLAADLIDELATAEDSDFELTFESEDDNALSGKNDDASWF